MLSIPSFKKLQILFRSKARFVCIPVALNIQNIDKKFAVVAIVTCTTKALPKDETETVQPKSNPSWDWKNHDENNKTLTVKWISPDYNSTTEYQWTPNSTLTIASESWTLPPDFTTFDTANNSLSSLLEMKPDFDFDFPELSFGNRSSTGGAFGNRNWSVPNFANSVPELFGSSNWTFPSFNWSMPEGVSMSWNGPKLRVTCSPECVSSEFPERSNKIRGNVVTLNWTVSRRNDDED